MKIFVTGGTGFMGTHVVRHCVGKGHELRCLARPMSNTSVLEELGVEIVRGDITDRGSLFKGMTGCDCVINAAAAYSFWTANPRDYRNVNVGGTSNVMESALKACVSKVVHVSSVVVYGKPAKSPVTEDTPVGPVRFSEYARTKFDGDMIAWHLYEKKGLPLVVVYPGAVLGPGDQKPSGEYVQDLIHRRMPATVLRSASFPFVHVADVAEAITRAAEKRDNVGEKYLLVSENLTFGEINAMVSEISGVPLPKLSLPDALAVAMAGLLTTLTRLTKKPPAWGMSLDQIRTMKEAPLVDGSKAERELGIRYATIRRALEEAIESYGE